MLPKFCKRCGFWLALLSLAQLGLLCMALNALYSQLEAENGAIFKNMSNSKLTFQIGTFVLVLLNFHVQLRKTCKCSHGYHSKRTGLILVFISCVVSFAYFLLFLFQSIFDGDGSTGTTGKHALIGSASFFLLWLTFTIQYYRIYEYVDSMVKINTDSGIQLTERAARDHYRILEYERAYLENGSLIRQYVRNCPVEHAEYYFLQKCIDKLEQLKFAPKGMHKLDEVVHDMRVRSNKFSGVSESDRQRYTELATRYPKIVQPSKDPYYEYDRRVIGNDLCANSKTVIWGGNRNTLL